MAKLHRIWYIDELVLTIFEQCLLSSAASLTRTSRHMYRLGTPLIWSSPPLSALTALAGLDAAAVPAPSKTVSAVSKSRPWRSCRRSKTRSRVEAERPRTRLQVLAPYVTDLVIVDASRDDNMPIELLLEAIQRQSMKSLFARLQSLVIIALSPEFLQLILEFAQLDLAWIKVFLNPPNIANIDDRLSGYEPFLPQLCTLSRLDALTLYGSDTTAAAERHFVSTVMRTFPELDTFDAWRMQTDTAFFRTISNAAQLAHLRIQLGALPDRAELGTISLPNLETLILEYDSNADLDNLLCCLKAPLLHLIQLDFHDTREVPHNDQTDTGGFTHRAYQRILERIASSWSQSLEELTISRVGPLRSHANSLRMWEFDVVRPLLSCHRMRKFQIPPAVLVNAEDADLIQIGQSWPRIRELSLAGFGSPVERAMCAGTKGFLALIGACRDLELLEVSVDLRDVSDIAPDIDNPPEEVSLAYNSPMRELSIHDCPAVDRDYTQKLLRRLFPKLEKFNYATGREFTWMNKDRPADAERVGYMSVMQMYSGKVRDGDR
ncbi:hypothetical protein CALVIDRAFT_99453 [Calocera viscosa TUFC12733]|uniref:F-box domain-containing protein n=1 Tax=Calocera viscosa (strain TUFC12733) TaxID=1330018 RepID=A0A167MK84_CALVF|nr:hypothetical protein CALVIDRAFT_99453 [Calocera viscosa TUFC12733]